jgi:hypothetical protein
VDRHTSINIIQSSSVLWAEGHGYTPLILIAPCCVSGTHHGSVTVTHMSGGVFLNHFDLSLSRCVKAGLYKLLPTSALAVQY